MRISAADAHGGETMRPSRLRAILVATALAGWVGAAAAAQCGNDGSGFKEWVADFKGEAASQGISQGTVDAALGGVKYSTATIKLDRNQKVFKQSFEKFSGRMIPPRIKRAKGQLAKHA